MAPAKASHPSTRPLVLSVAEGSGRMAVCAAAFMSSYLAPVARVNLHVIIRKVASPQHRISIPAIQHHTNGDVALLHHTLSILLAVTGGTPAMFGDQTLIEIQPESGNIQIVAAGIADRGEDTSEVGVGGEECGFDQWRAGDGI